jgi:hypothetical protein
MSDLRLTDEEIALILDLDEERTYKSAGLQVTTIDVYPLLDAQLAKLSEMKDREAKAVEEAKKHIEDNYKKAMINSLPPRYLRKVIQALKESNDK